jgi:AraC-like DNA-binding protein
MRVLDLPSYFIDTPSAALSGPTGTIVRYQHSARPKRHPIRLHAPLISLVTSGTKVVHHADDRIVARAPAGLLLAQGSYLMTEHLHGDDGYQSYLFFFAPDHLPDLTRDLPAPPAPAAAPCPVYPIALDGRLQALLDTLPAYFADPPREAGPLVAIKQRELLFNLMQHTARDAVWSILLRDPVAVELLQTLERHYRDPLSLDELAFLIGSSVSTLKRQVEQHFGTTPHRWIRDRRLQEAHHLLRTTSQRVNEVSLEVGFENLSHFVQAFKARYGITPKQHQLEQRRP